MARDEDLSLAMLQGTGPSQVGFYPLSVLGRWPPFNTLDEAALSEILIQFDGFKHPAYSDDN